MATPFSELPEHWRLAFELAWEAFLAGSPPVGAVITDDSGVIVASGRSRLGESTGPPGALAGSRVAHAEVNALAMIPVSSSPASLTLHTTLESCFLCAAATAMTRIPRVEFAGADPFWRFLDDPTIHHERMRTRWYQRSGPWVSPLGAWAALLVICDTITRHPASSSLAEWRRNSAALTVLGDDLVASGQVEAWREMPQERALASVMDRLEEASGDD